MEIDISYSATGLAIFSILIYGFIAVLLEGIRFDLVYSGIIVFGIFLIESLAYLFEKIINR